LFLLKISPLSKEKPKMQSRADFLFSKIFFLFGKQAKRGVCGRILPKKQLKTREGL
jgi:hypothetical protein